MTGLPSASSATLVAGELDVRFVEHSVDGAERLGVTAHQLFSAFGGVCGPTSTLPLEGRYSYGLASGCAEWFSATGIGSALKISRAT